MLELSPPRSCKRRSRLTQAHHRTKLVSSQDEFSLLVRDLEGDRLPLIEKFGMSELPYFPLASGMLTGKHKRGQVVKGTRLADKASLAEKYLNEANHAKVEQLEKFAKEHGHTLLELAFGWLLSHKVVASVIAGATKPEQIDANAKAGDWELSSEELAEVDRITGVASPVPQTT